MSIGSVGKNLHDAPVGQLNPMAISPDITQFDPDKDFFEQASQTILAQGSSIRGVLGPGPYKGIVQEVVKTPGIEVAGFQGVRSVRSDDDSMTAAVRSRGILVTRPRADGTFVGVRVRIPELHQLIPPAHKDYDAGLVALMDTHLGRNAGHAHDPATSRSRYAENVLLMYPIFFPIEASMNPPEIGDIVTVDYQNSNTLSGPVYMGLHREKEEDCQVEDPDPANASRTRRLAKGGNSSPGSKAFVQPYPNNHTYTKAKRLPEVKEYIEGIGFPPAQARAEAEHALWTMPSVPHCANSVPPYKNCRRYKNYYGSADAATNETIRSALERYWRATRPRGGCNKYCKGVQPTSSSEKIKKTSKKAWSAAYISYILQGSGFIGAISHLRYQGHNADTGTWKVFSLIRGDNIDKIKIKVGDVLVKTRKGCYKNIKPCKPSKGASHGDVVYKIEGNKAYLSGGNIRFNSSESMAGIAKVMKLKGDGTLVPAHDRCVILKRMAPPPLPPGIAATPSDKEPLASERPPGSPGSAANTAVEKATTPSWPGWTGQGSNGAEDKPGTLGSGGP